MKTLFTPVIALAALTLPAVATAQQARMPAELIGIWSNDDEEGRAQCADYRKDPFARDDGYDPLVGAVVIRKGLIHSYSEYGEGNFYKVEQVSPSGAKRWRIRSRLYLDTRPPDRPVRSGDDESTPVTDTLTLEGATLSWEAPEEETRTLFRCGGLPK